MREGARFCGACGRRLGAAEAQPAPPRAKPAASPTSAFHSYTPKHLADKILTARSALEGERRQVTVLFADVAGFTTLAEQLDPEETHRIINRCFELITAEVHRFEGTINQYTGDGVMALFGAPIAHEDGPRRAAHAALGIQRALWEYGKEFQRERGLSIQMRIGLNTGPVVVGRIGDDLRMDYTAVGDTTNLAARMQQIARPGSVTATESTHKLLAGFFETLDLGEVIVKGHAPVRAFEVLRARARRARLDVAAERGLTPLVGRERELAALLELFRQVKAGHGQVVHVVGEAGIGKSRVALEFRRALVQAGEDVTWLEGRCISFGHSIPFLPIIDQLRENFRIEEFDGEPEIIAKVEHGMRRMGQLDAHIPFVRTLLGVDPGDPGVSAMEPLVRRRKIFDAVQALSVRGAARRPIVFLVEDLHWIDPTSEEYLGHMLDSVAGLAIMLILTYRVGYTPPFGTRSFSTTLTLRSLSDAESLSMASRVLGTSEFPPELRTALMEKAEGVPLFVEEVTKTLLDLGLVRRENGRLILVKGAATVSVPDTIQGIIMARLDRLGEDGKRTVQLASVIGRQFLVRLLERIAGLTGELEGLLGELKALEIIYELGLLPEPAYIFKHAVIQDVAYNSLLKERRRELHRSVGHAIEDLYPERLADHAEELAHHFVNGEEWPKAFEYLAQSADKAKYAYANQAALDYYQRALEAAHRVTPPLPPTRLMEVHQRRSQVWVQISRYDEATTDSERMLELARSSGDRLSEAEALVDLALIHWAKFSRAHTQDVERCAEAALAIAKEIGDQRVLARSLWGLALVDQLNGRLVEADSKMNESLRLAEAGGFRQIVVPNRLWLGAHANWRGEFGRAIELTREAEREAAAIHDGFHELLSLAFRCLAQTCRGEYAEGLQTIQEGLRKAQERNNTFIGGRLTNTLGWFHQELGDFRRALEYDRQGAEIGKQAKNANVEISSLINLGLDHLHLGQTREALSLLEDTLIRVDKHAFGAHRWRWSNHLIMYVAEALLTGGDTGRALMETERALVQARETGSRKYVAKCLALRGEITLRERQWAQAEADLAESLRTAQEIVYPPLIWQAAHLLSRAQLAQDKRESALAAGRLAGETIEQIAAAAPDETLTRTFLAWPRVDAAREYLARLRP